MVFQLWNMRIVYWSNSTSRLIHPPHQSLNDVDKALEKKYKALGHEDAAWEPYYDIFMPLKKHTQIARCDAVPTSSLSWAREVSLEQRDLGSEITKWNHGPSIWGYVILNLQWVLIAINMQQPQRMVTHFHWLNWPVMADCWAVSQWLAINRHVLRFSYHKSYTPAYTKPTWFVVWSKS